MSKRLTVRILIALPILAIGFGFYLFYEKGCSFSFRPEVAAVVVDAETNQAIEGAVAIAIWRRVSYVKRAWFEGGTEVPIRIEEAVSDKDGKLYIRGFWGWHYTRSRYPHLAVYKPGYVCWDQEYVFARPSWRRRNDFDNDRRVVKLEKWKEGYSYISHEGFVSSVTQNEARKAKDGLFYKAFRYEVPYRLRESEPSEQRLLEEIRRRGQ